MPFSEDNQNWIREEIRKAVYPNGFKKFADKLRYWGLLGICITAFITLIGMVITVGIFATNRISQESEFRGNTVQQLKTIDQRLSGIETTLGLLRAQTVAQKYSSVLPKELKKHSEELKQVKATLAQLEPNTPDYWPVTFRIITLVSQTTAEAEKALGDTEGELDNVSSNPPGAIRMYARRIVLKNLIQGVILENSIIRFDPSVRLSNVVFINCVFVFPVEQNPSKPLQEIGRTLLASDLSKVTLNAS